MLLKKNTRFRATHTNSKQSSFVILEYDTLKVHLFIGATSLFLIILLPETIHQPFLPIGWQKPRKRENKTTFNVVIVNIHSLNHTELWEQL